MKFAQKLTKESKYILDGSNAEICWMELLSNEAHYTSLTIVV